MALNSRIRNSFKETFRTLFSPLTLFIWAASIIVATIAGPFDTYMIGNMVFRVAYWAVLVSAAIIVGYSVKAVSIAVVGAGRPGLLDGTIVVLMTVVFSPVVWLVAHYAKLLKTANTTSLLAMAGYVMLCTAVVVVGRRVAPGFETRQYQFLPDPEPDPVRPDAITDAPRLLRRLSPEVQGRILRITANDHFVEIATENGAESLRMRLVDAIDEMEPIYGYCVHRSHWVAHEGIVRVERENTHKVFLVLTNNDRVPVSRKYRVNVENAGWV